MCGLDRLEFGYVLFFFARVTIGVVLQSEFAVLFLDIFAACGSGQVEVSIYRSWSVLVYVGELASMME
jgi:hypothetical protein